MGKELRTGYTTGACATAATKGALSALITKKVQTEATIFLPVGKFVTFELVSCVITSEWAKAGTIKDGGDDPDATHGAMIEATVTWNEERLIVVDGGVGVGRVTKKGLPVAVGMAAINPVPREMIKATAEELLQAYGIDKGVTIIISVPLGEEIAQKTLNPRLGIIGGISILGTRGIVVPFSNEAYMDSITQGINVAASNGCNHVVVTTGGRSEKYGMRLYPYLPQEAFIEMGDFVGWTLLQCKRHNLKKVTIVGMMGKLSKLAHGEMNVHSNRSKVNFQFLSDVAREIGVGENLLTYIRKANTAMQVGELMVEHQYPLFFTRLCELACFASLKEISGGLIIETYLFTLDGVLLGKAVTK